MERSREMRGESLGNAWLYLSDREPPGGDHQYRYWEALDIAYGPPEADPDYAPLRELMEETDYQEVAEQIESFRIDGVVLVYPENSVSDHIVPWQASYRTTQLLPKSSVRYVLSSAGHIAGIVNPPGPKASSRWRADNPADADEWLAGTEDEPRSWWEIWAEWAEPRGGGLVAPPPIGSESYPAVADAPGTYVHG